MKRENVTAKVKEVASELTNYWWFEPDDKWCGVYYVYHQDKVYPWVTGEDKPYWKHDEFCWIPDIIDCVNKIKEMGLLYRFQNSEGTGCRDEFAIWNDPEDCPIASGHSGSPLESALYALLELLKREDEKHKFVR